MIPQDDNRPYGQIALITFLSAFFLSYPLKVFVASDTLEIIRPGFLIATAILAMANLNLYSFYKAYRTQGWFILGLACAAIALASLFINQAYFPNSQSLSTSLRKHASYTAWLAIVFVFGDRMSIQKNKTWSLITTIWVIASVWAVSQNSLLHRIPAGTELDDKYYVGLFLRAGGGYLDPNFLSIYFFLLARIARLSVSNKLLIGLLYSGIIFCVAMTFSRAGLVLFAVFHFNDARKILQSWQSKTIIIGVITGVIWWISTSDSETPLLFSRFSNNEGSSSTSDRITQYTVALQLLSPGTIAHHFILGFGGLDFFYTMYGVHLHNYILATYLDSGLMGMCLVTCFFLCFWKGARFTDAKIMLSYAAIQLMFLPNQPDSLYLAASLAMLRPQGKPEETSNNRN